MPADTILGAVVEAFQTDAALTAAFPGGVWPCEVSGEGTPMPYLVLRDHSETAQETTEPSYGIRATLTLRAVAPGFAADAAAAVILDRFEAPGFALPLAGGLVLTVILRLRYQFRPIRNRFKSGQNVCFGDVTYLIDVQDNRREE